MIIYTLSDISPPSITCPADKVFTLGKNQATITATWDAPKVTDNSGYAPTVFQTMPSGITLGPGVFPVTVMASDRFGQRSTCTFKITVQRKSGLSVICTHTQESF